MSLLFKLVFPFPQKFISLQKNKDMDFSIISIETESNNHSLAAFIPITELPDITTKFIVMSEIYPKTFGIVVKKLYL